MAEVISIGEKGQIVIPKKFRDDLNLEKGMKLLIEEEGKTIKIRKIELNENSLWMLVGEETLKKTWDNPYDKRWDEVL